MVLEVADFQVVPGSEQDFSLAYRGVRHVVEAAAGCRSMRMTHGIESPTRFVLLVEWDSVQAHDDFRASEAFTTWRAAIGPFFAHPPLVEHFADV